MYYVGSRIVRNSAAKCWEIWIKHQKIPHCSGLGIL